MSGNDPKSQGGAGARGTKDDAVQKVLDHIGVAEFDYLSVGGDEAARESRNHWPLVDLVSSQLEGATRRRTPQPPVEAAPARPRVATPRPRRPTPTPSAPVVEARGPRRDATPTQPIMAARARGEDTPLRAAAGGRQVSRPRIIVERRAQVPPVQQAPSAEPPTTPAAPQPHPRGRLNSGHNH